MPQLYRQLLEQLSQWIIPKDLRHLTNCAEIVAAILSAESASMAQTVIEHGSATVGFEQYRPVLEAA